MSLSLGNQILCGAILAVCPLPWSMHVDVPVRGHVIAVADRLINRNMRTLVLQLLLRRLVHLWLVNHDAILQLTLVLVLHLLQITQRVCIV